MSGRRIPPYAMKGGPPPQPHHDAPFGRGPLPPPHHHLRDVGLPFDDLRDVGPPFAAPPRGGPRPPLFPPPHSRPAAIIEDRIAAQHQEIQSLLADNQMLAATHVALKQELAAAQNELQRMSHAAGNLQADRDLQLREIYEKSMKMEAELREIDGMRAELNQIRGDIQKLNASRQELNGQVQLLTQDLSKATANVQQAPAIKAEIELMKQELQQARQAIEYERKGYEENYKQGTVMEKNLISMAREVEKLRAEVVNADKRARAAAAAGNQGSAATTYTGNYGNPDPKYGGNPYPAPATYGINPQVPGTADGGSQYPAGAGSAPGHGSWGPYDMQRSHARR